MSPISLCSQSTGGSVSGGKRATRAATAQAEALVDANLVRRFNQGDEAAFDEITRRHRGRIANVVGGFLHDRSDVEEVVDDVFVRAYRGLANFRGQSSLATWLHHIAMNLARNRYWVLVRHRRFATSLDAPLADGKKSTLADVVAAEGCDPSQDFDQREFSAVVATCMNRLPLRHREILRLRTRVDASYADIAVKLGINLGTVRSRIARARSRLRKDVDAIAPETPLRSTTSF